MPKRRPQQPSRGRQDPLRVLVGRRVTALRDARGLTRAKLAAESNVGLSALIALENAAAYPTLRTLERVAKGLRVRLADLIDDEAPPPPPTTKLRSRLARRLDALDERQLHTVERLVRVLIDSWEESR